MRRYFLSLTIVLIFAVAAFPVPAVSEEAASPREMEQGTVITCEECVILYPERYRENPGACPVCKGKKEHFQRARMMDGALIDEELAKLESRIEEFLFQAVLGAAEAPVKTAVLRELRALYVEKLKFHLVYSRLEAAPIKARILELDSVLSSQLP
jgi:hypothetical protein